MRQPLKITRNHVHTLAKRISRNRHMADRKSIREEIVKAANVNVTYLYLNGNMLAIGKMHEMKKIDFVIILKDTYKKIWKIWKSWVSFPYTFLINFSRIQNYGSFNC